MRVYNWEQRVLTRKELCKKQQQKLMKLNKQLRIAEKTAMIELDAAKIKLVQFKAKKTDDRAYENDEVSRDYEINSMVYIIDYHNNKKRIVSASQIYGLGKVKRNWNWDDSHYRREGEPLTGFSHCHLFHDLYDHQYVLWEDLLKVNQIVIVTELVPQKILTLMVTTHPVASKN